MNEVYVLPKWAFMNRKHILEKGGRPFEVVDTTSGSGDFRGLSPFVLGPCRTYLPGVCAKNLENLWQYSKVYQWHTMLCDTDTMELAPSGAWYAWRDEGWANPKAIRYPMGKGVKPLFSWWDGKRLSYVQARKQIYALHYFANVMSTDSFKRLREIFQQRDLILLDFDAYDHRLMNRTLKDVINDPYKKCGHAFILAMILTGVLPDCVED